MILEFILRVCLVPSFLHLLYLNANLNITLTRLKYYSLVFYNTMDNYVTTLVSLALGTDQQMLCVVLVRVLNLQISFD